VVGKDVLINSAPFRISGVAPREFFGTALDYPVDIWAPIAAQPQIEPSRRMSSGTDWLWIMGRPKPGVSIERAAANLNVVFQQALRAEGATPEELAQRVLVMPADRPVSGLRHALSRPLLVLMAIVGLVLLIACANIANLLLARAAARQREISVRVAIGAGRLRLIRQLLTESLLLGALGGVVAILFAMWGANLLLALVFNDRLLEGPIPLPLHIRPDANILGFTALVSVLTGLLFGLAPALRASKADLSSVLKSGTPSLRRARASSTLLALQLALSLVLLISAGLLVRSFQKAGQVDLGFDPRNVVQFTISDTATGRSAPQLTSLVAGVVERIRSVPGVASATLSLPGLFSHMNFFTTVSPDGPPRKRLGELDADRALFIAPGFFQAMRTPLVAGRDFTLQDSADSRVALVNEALARRYFPGANPIGRRLHLMGEPPVEIIGLVKDAKFANVTGPAPTILYLPIAQRGMPPLRFIDVRLAANAPEVMGKVRKIVEGADSRFAVEARPLTELVGRTLALQRLGAWLAGCFGVLGLLLACVGVYGLMSYAALQRTGEVGIRMALGAQRSSVLWLVLRQAMRPVLAGAGIGVGLALAATRVFGSHLFGLSATDPLTIAACTLVLVGMAALASYLPARRASRVDPVTALRYE
jgi:predicted permease